MGLAVWCHDQAGPYPAVPQPGASWQPLGEPVRQPSEYIRQGTAKLLTLFHPAGGQVRVRGVNHCPNTVLHPWLKSELSAILAQLPPATQQLDPLTTGAMWRRWQDGLSVRFTLPKQLLPLRMLLVLDNLAAPKGLLKTPDFVLWLVAQGIMPLYTPLGGSWLSMAESIQRILFVAPSPVSLPRHLSRLSTIWTLWLLIGTKRRLPLCGEANAPPDAFAPTSAVMLSAAQVPIPVVPSRLALPNCKNSYAHLK